MFKFVVLLSVLFSISSFASTNGGGVLRANMMAVGIGDLANNPEIILHLGENNGKIKFAYGQLVGKQWQIEKFEMPAAELVTDASVIKALQDSKFLKTWTELK